MQNTNRPLRVFLCHSSADKPAVRELYQRLRADGFEPWLDEEDLIPGQDWQREIPKAVKNSDVVIVCLSSGAVNKAGYIQKEIKFALDVADEQPEDTIFIIPLKLEECEVPDRLSRWHWVNYFSPNGHGKLLRALNARAKSLEISALQLSTPEQERVLDAAIARRVPIEKPTELVALVRQANSAGLQAILEIDDTYSISKDEVKSKPFKVEFPLDSSGVPRSAQLTLKVESPDFEPKSQQKKIPVPVEGDSEPCVFLITPKHTGELQLNLEVYAGDIYITSRVLKTNGEVSDRAIITDAKMLVSVPFFVTGYASAVASISSSFNPDIIAEHRAKERAEAERVAALKAEEEHNARKKAEQERLAQETAEADQLDKLRAETRQSVFNERRRQMLVRGRIFGGLIALGLVAGLYMIVSVAISGNNAASISATQTAVMISPLPSNTLAPTATPTPSRTSTGMPKLTATPEWLTGRVKAAVPIYTDPLGSQVIGVASEDNVFYLCHLEGERYEVATNNCDLDNSLGWIDATYVEPLFEGKFPETLTTPYSTRTPSPTAPPKPTSTKKPSTPAGAASSATPIPTQSSTSLVPGRLYLNYCLKDTYNYSDMTADCLVIDIVNLDIIDKSRQWALPYYDGPSCTSPDQTKQILWYRGQITLQSRDSNGKEISNTYVGSAENDGFSFRCTELGAFYVLGGSLYFIGFDTPRIVLVSTQNGEPSRLYRGQ